MPTSSEFSQLLTAVIPLESEVRYSRVNNIYSMGEFNYQAYQAAVERAKSGIPIPPKEVETALRQKGREGQQSPANFDLKKAMDLARSKQPPRGDSEEERDRFAATL